MKNLELYQAIGRKIRAQREAKRMSQGELAKLVGLSRASVTNIELGRQSLLLDQLYCFAAALETPPSDFLPKVSNRSRRLTAEPLSADAAAWIERARKAVA